MEANENTIITCAECGCVEEDLYLMDGKYYCADCLERLGYVRCDECGEWIPEDEAVVYNDEWVCEDCVDRLSLEKCDECGEYHDDTSEVIGRYRSSRSYCRSCLEDAIDRGRVFYCEDCETYYEERWYSSYITHDGKTICEGCYEDYYDRCPDCDEIFPRSDMYWSDSDDCYYCENCISDHEGNGDEIHEYSYKPSPIFHGLNHWGSPDADDPITMGFELEVDKGSNRGDCSYDLNRFFGDDTLYMKNDSSVDFEIVTHPHTLAAYMNDLDFDKLCSIPKEYEYKSHDARTCGFHIHVGRTQLGKYRDDQERTIDRIAILMYRMWPALVKFSRRTDEQLSHWASAPNFDFGQYSIYNEQRIKYVIDDYYATCGRYQALNLCPRDTIEFRLWRGSLQPTTLKATLQLTSNIVMFAKTHTMEEAVHASWEDITNYESYPELESYLKEHGLETFGDARNIPWSLSEAERITLPEPPVLFDIGDHVIITNSVGSFVADPMVGVTGIVRYSRRAEGTPLEREYCIQLDSDTPIDLMRSYAHTCEGHTPGFDGYWALGGNLAPWP